MFFSKERKNQIDDELYERCYHRVFTAVNLIVRDPELTKDAVQEGFYKAFCNVQQLREKNKFCAWVIRIAINQAKNMLRKNSRQVLTNEVELSRQIDTSGYNLPDPVSDSVLLKNEVTNVLAELNPADREILVLKYLLDYSTEEIAAILETSTQNVNQRLRRAREKYRIKNTLNKSSESLERCGL
ncbi:RNA polymerase sigma factor [Desulfosporosinus youngiae]|uniref:RNA polymerase sigma factor, sigma-70 family n=1 Tax=Desulfosporosinus youngiae DSM 17734 TaxID=768710 RepID=H5Y5P2_9FIRM|nr:sigma-70 family RNA polymerase sigma factor [Desulfosporosinus youngiae]EHQ90768.1 RNA polymerase sigma factor, sigma-70 family [Desulfosporosinus youngiae DSM 17734]